jgi:hypothetical protein
MLQVDCFFKKKLEGIISLVDKMQCIATLLGVVVCCAAGFNASKFKLYNLQIIFIIRNFPFNLVGVNFANLESMCN